MQVRKIALLLLLLISLTVNVFAAGPLDRETGTISVTMHYDEMPVGGGTLTIYHIAEPVWQDAAYEFVFTQAFEGCELPLDVLNTQETANQYAQYAVENRIQGATKTIDSEGNVKFDELKLGLYLLVQQDAAEGYYEAKPFLITVPIEENGEWNYDVDASPKVSLHKEPTPTEPKPQKPPAISQTGQLNWPIPVLCVAGLALIVIGWALFFGKKSKDEA